jgi:glutathione synthase/RimK-type ligase-like ATP-grasp enzyme
MNNLIVVENQKNWPLNIVGAEIVSARDYLTNPRFIDLKRANVFNLCRNYGYQTLGYYVSLLATARNHRPLPSVTTIQDLRESALVRIASEDIEDQLERSLASLKSDSFTLSIYFGRNMAKRYDRLCQMLFNHFPAPLLRAEFVRRGQWQLLSLRPIATAELPQEHREFVIEQAQRFFKRPRIGEVKHQRWDLAILVNPAEDPAYAPSDAKAIDRFTRAGEKLGIAVWQINRSDFGHLGEYDALFIRETTSVNHHTFRFARRAEAEGLVVIDDPESIIRCTNKVYQAELFDRHGIPSPRTMIVHRGNREEVGATLGFPCVLKRPDSSFSAGVVKASDAQELQIQLDGFFEDSDLVVAQEWAPSQFDWRVGVIDRKALYVCRYHMAQGHWQIQRTEGKKSQRFGKVEALSVEEAPQEVVELAVRAANLIGDGLYGVDIKDLGDRLVVMEINDNPSIDAGCEDSFLKEELYLSIMRVFRDRIDRRGLSANGGAS